MASMGSSWRGRAEILALVAGAVWAASVVAEGPPGNGYGWESVAISAGIVAGAFGLMAYFVHAGTAGRALAAATLAILLAALSIASLIGNWAYQPAGARAFAAIAAVFAVAASGLVLTVAIPTVRHPRPTRSHPVP